MTDPFHIVSVTDFKRNPKGHLRKIKRSGQPAMLTAKGRAEFVIQDAQSYEELLGKVRAAEDIEAVRSGLTQSLNGGGRPASKFFEEFERSRGLQ